MRFIQTELPDVFIIEPKAFGDQRGYFMESYRKDRFAEHGLDFDFIQDNHAFSASPHVLRGLHFQVPPKAQTKLVRVARGAVFDVAVDLRAGSPWHGKWVGVELSEENRRQLLIPKGFAHGYLSLTPDTVFLYKVDEYYAPECDAGIAWNDPDIGVDWPRDAPILSDKDTKLPRLGEYTSPFTHQA